ncbi:Purine nucleoside phosphorylase 1 [Novipirellula aureliae]|uniref:Purine nucleoside phosphorylase n=1 Tax=Novipirellula aureliae TaxID=2527966 RepID=A0A5C6DV19_9BACT|nr:purine-nucleoside phosphorylase [Novipirellula aureliae]TWU41213.1 Purine nucleoside phosphorylase 1 [Novipirellula aureliae]
MLRTFAPNTRQQIDAACDLIRSHDHRVPAAAVILGSGLGGLADKIEDPVAIDFAEIPGFATSTASGHRGQLILGTIEGLVVAAMAGRFHRYEGHGNDKVTFPVYTLAALGASRLIVSNAAGGVNPKLRVGDILVIRDHIDWLSGVSSGVVSMAQTGLSRFEEFYDSAMSEIAIRTSLCENFTAYPGTYLATLGPTYETRAEYRMMRRIGVDVVGMSTVPEAMAAKNANMKVLGLSMVSNVANPDIAISTNHDEVLEAGRRAEVRMESIVRAVLKSSE